MTIRFFTYYDSYNIIRKAKEVGLTAILREAWNTSQHTGDRREKIQALSLAKECYSMKLDLLTNATVVGDAIRFITRKDAAGGAAHIEPKTEAALVVDEE